MRSTRSRAPESGPKRQGPRGQKRTTKLRLEPDAMLFDELVHEVRARHQALQGCEVGAGQQFLLSGSRGIKASAAPDQLQVRESHAAAAARSAAAQAIVFE